MSPNISSSGVHFWYTMTIDLITNTGKCLQISPVQVFISDTQWQLISSPIQGNVSKYLHFRYPFLLHNDRWSHITNTGKYKEWKNRCQKTWWDTCWWTDDDYLCCSAETKQVRKTGTHHVDHADQTVAFSFTQPVTNTTSRGRTEPWGLNTLWTNARDDTRRTGD